MKRCPITYEEITAKETYSRRGLHALSPQLKNLNPLNLSAAEQRMEAIARAGKMSIQGVQTKLSARLNIKEQCFDIVDQYGHLSREANKLQCLPPMIYSIQPLRKLKRKKSWHCL